MKLFNLQVTDELHAELMKAAAAADRSASAFVREKIARANIKAVPAVPVNNRRSRVRKAA
jgi:predicted HicB family RNase H-like nuclease